MYLKYLSYSLFNIYVVENFLHINSISTFYFFFKHTLTNLWVVVVPVSSIIRLYYNKFVRKTSRVVE